MQPFFPLIIAGNHNKQNKGQKKKRYLLEVDIWYVPIMEKYEEAK